MRMKPQRSLLLLLLLRQTLTSFGESRRRRGTGVRRGRNQGGRRGGATTEAPPIRRRHLHQTECEISCHAVQPEGLVETDHEDDHNDGMDVPAKTNNKEDSTIVIDCILRDGKRHRIIPLLGGLSIEFQDDLEAGSLHLCIAKPFWTDDGSIDLSRSGEYRKLEDTTKSSWRMMMVEDRLLQQQKKFARQGVKTLLAVRVIANGVAPIETLSDMEGAIFGTGPNAVSNSVVKQYGQISHGQLHYTPLLWNLNNNNQVQNGVMELTMPSLQGVSVQGQFTELLLNQTQDILLGEDDSSDRTLADAVDNIIFCLPDGGLFKNSTEWTAFTYLFEPYSYYQKQRLVHELGHSLGFQHSGVGDNIYADKTGYMGYAVNQVGAPLKAFNAHKHWIAGWFQNRAITVDPYQSGTSYMRLVGFVHASDTRLQDKDVVLIRVAPYLYIQFNVARGYNRDADEPNKIVIVEALAEDKVSTRKATLSKTGDTYTHLFSQGTIGTVIEVCSIVLEEGFVSHAMISVHLENASSACTTNVDIWSPNWDNNIDSTTTAAPGPAPGAGGTDNYIGGTPEDNDGSDPTHRLTLQPAVTPNNDPNTPTQPTPMLPVSPWALPSKSPVGSPSPSDPTGGVIDEEEEQSRNPKVIGGAVAGAIVGLFLLVGLIYCCCSMIRHGTSAVQTDPKANRSEQTIHSDKSSDNKDPDVTETEVEDWWDGWFNFDFGKVQALAQQSCY